MRWTRRSRRLMVITGANGFLGRHLVRASEADAWELVAPGSTALDITQRERTLDGIAGWKPTVVVHLAYRKDRRTIVDGSRHVAEAAAACGAHLVHLSTDVVFAGRPAPYVEADLPDARLDYGRWKAEAEAVVTASHPTAVLVRTSLLYGTESLGHCQTDVAAIGQGDRGPTFFVDEFRCPAHVADVAAAVSRLAGRPEVRGPLHVAGPERISRADFATANARFLGIDPASIRTGSLADSGLDRPADVVLDSSLAASLGIRCRPLDDALR